MAAIFLIESAILHELLNFPHFFICLYVADIVILFANIF